MGKIRVGVRRSIVVVFILLDSIDSSSSHVALRDRVNCLDGLHICRFANALLKQTWQEESSLRLTLSADLLS